MRTSAITALFLTIALALPACSGSDGDDDGTGSHTEHTGHDGTDSTDASCPTADIYVAGLEKAGVEGNFTVTLMASTPGPPEKGNNDWSLEVHSGGKAAAGVFVEAEPVMPAHGHGTSPATVDGTSDADGKLTLSPVNLFMAGEWRIELRLEASDGTKDTVSYRFCIEG